MRRRGSLVLIALLAGLLGAYNSDALLFGLSESLADHLRQRIQRRYRNDGVVALWTFDGLAVTESRTGTDSRNFGTVLTEGKYGKARAFDGKEDDYIVTNVAWRSLGDQYTISTWVNLRPSSRTQSIVFSAGPHSGIMLLDGNMVLAVPDKESRFAAYPFEKYGQYVNITGVVDLGANKAALYEDGMLKATIEIQGVTHARGDIEFGKYRLHHVYHPVDGALDETVIWGRALSPAEVREVARHSLAGVRSRIGGYAVALSVVEWVSAAVNTSIKILDFFNPLYDEARLHNSGLPRFDLNLSRKDLRYVSRSQRRALEEGDATNDASKSRRVKLVFEGVVYEAEMAPYGEEADFWVNPKWSFTLEAEALRPVFGARKVLFVPPETKGLLRPLFYRELAQRYKLPSPRNGLGIVKINGGSKGLYYFEADLVEGHPFSHEEAGFPGVVTRLPLPPEDVLKEYDVLRTELEPILVRDQRISWNSRQIQAWIRRDRKTLEKLVELAKGRSKHDEVEMVKRYLGGRVVLNGNPSKSYIIGDLNLDVVNVPTVRVTWATSHPGIIDHEGRVVRPKRGDPVSVSLEASITRGEVAEKMQLRVTVMPEGVKLPVLRLFVPVDVRNTHRTPCYVELIEDGGSKRTGWLAGGIKFHGNTSLRHRKKSYSLRLEERRPFFEFSNPRIVHLISSVADPSFMNSKLAYDLFRSFAEDGAPRYSPRVRLVEVFLNDEYHGVYQMSERVDRFLLNFPRSSERDTVQSVIYKAQDNTANFRTFVKGAYRQVEPDARDGEYWAPLEELIRFIGNADRETFRTEIGRVIDIPTYIDFHLLVNLFNNREGREYNLFLARSNKLQRRFIVIPWDYDKSFFAERDGWLTNWLFTRLMNDVPEFKGQFTERWNQLRSRELSDQAILGLIDDMQAEMAEGVRRESERWPRDGVSHENVVSDIKRSIRSRLRFLDEYIGGM